MKKRIITAAYISLNYGVWYHFKHPSFEWCHWWSCVDMDISSLALWRSGSWSHLVLSSYLLDNQKTIMKYWALEEDHTHCLAKTEGMFVSKVIRKTEKWKTSCFPLVFQKDGLIWQSKPHSHQWAKREGSQQPHVVTSSRCCRKSDRGHFHHAITTSHLEAALLWYQELYVADRGKTSPSLLLSFWSLGWHLGIFILFSEISTLFTFIEVPILLSTHFNSLPGISLLSHLPLSH